MNNLLSKEDFGDLSKFDGLSAFDCLVLVAQKARKKRNSDYIRLPRQKIAKRQKEIKMVENVHRRQTAVRKKTVHHPRRQPAAALLPEPALPERFRQKIRELNGSEPEFVIQRELTKSDFKERQNRFVMPEGRCGVNLNEVGRDSKVRMIAVLHDANEEPHERVVTFTHWDSTHVYVFKSEWIHFIRQTTHLHTGDVVGVWTFRYPSGQHGFALVKLQ